MAAIMKGPVHASINLFFLIPTLSELRPLCSGLTESSGFNKNGSCISLPKFRSPIENPVSIVPPEAPPWPV